METQEELDVRVLIPTDRHSLLNKMFNELPAGESFTFINDHDPKPLYYEFQSIHGDVVGWEYLNQGGREWKVKVTRLANSVGRDFDGANTLIDLRKTNEEDKKHTVFHRYGTMLVGDTMELISEGYPNEIKEIFDTKFQGEFDWKYKKQEPQEVIAHITKVKVHDKKLEESNIIEDFDLRPYPPAQRHDMVFETFDKLKSGEAFVFINDHDPKPLYYQIEAENTEPFKWEYLVSGPIEWKIKVSKD
ncbi:MAG: DUF2249 domain-containing protein [Brumimicrobium sp.]|nr:DUF2249 domain-containing protein [Brumimicrobium sp.]